jgi:hypothetical protein
MNIKKREALGILKKFELEPRPNKELVYKFYHEGRFVLSTAVPKGQGDMHCKDKFRKQLFLSLDQFSDAIRCPFKKEHFIQNLRDKGLIN